MNLEIGETMSEIARDCSTTDKKIRKPNYKRNISGELDVFEATRYFSDFNEPTPTTIEFSRIQIQKQNIVTEHRQNRVHPETEKQLPEPRVVVVAKPQEKDMTRGGVGKLTSVLNSLLRSAGLKKSKSKLKSTPKVETPREERRRRNSCVVTTHAADASPLSGVAAWLSNARRRSLDEKHVMKKSDQKLNIRFCERLCLEQKARCKDRNAADGDDDANGGCDTDSSSESDLFEFDFVTKSNP